MKVWGSGSQAQLSLDCKDGFAWIKLAFQLGHPSSPHFTPPPPSMPPPNIRYKSPARCKKDRERAAAYQQRKQDLAKTATKEAEDSVTDEVPNSPTEQALFQLL